MIYPDMLNQTPRDYKTSTERLIYNYKCLFFLTVLLALFVIMLMSYIAYQSSVIERQNDKIQRDAIAVESYKQFINI